MSVTKINDTFRTVARDGWVSRKDVEKLAAAARTDGVVDAQEKAVLSAILDRHQNRFSRVSRGDMEKLINGAPAPVITPTPTPAPTPAEPERVTIEATRQPWTTTYFPMASNNGDTDGSPSSNLWAKDGALDKFDALLKARGRQAGAREFELKPALNWLLQNSEIMKGETRRAEKGEWIADSNLSEKDAEKTTGVDFNGNGKIDENVEWDFLDANGQFGVDGKTDGSMSVSWWGSCDKTARAGILFAEPKKSVTIDGVTFTPQDIKGLLTVIADSQGGGSDFVGNRWDNNPDLVYLKNGERLSGRITSEVNWSSRGVKNHQDYAVPGELPETVTIRQFDGTEKTFKKSEIELVARENKRDDAALFHTTIQDWLKSGRPAVMDKDSGDHVWNYAFHATDDLLYRDGLKPSWANFELTEGFHGPAGDGKITYVERKVKVGSGTETYKYWLEEKDGKVVNSGWAPGSKNPDFLWRPQTEPAFNGHNERNPFIDPALVKELYEKSIE